MSDDNTQGGAEPSPASAGSVATPLEQIIRGTVRLHELIEQGRCDSEEADALRDEMDAPFLELSESEREAVRLVSAAIKDREWIPVTERLPEPCVNALAYAITEWRPGGAPCFTVTAHSGEYWFCDSMTITHWMPLPAPPTDDK